MPCIHGKGKDLLIVYLDEGLKLETGKVHLDPTLGPKEWSYCNQGAKLQKTDVGNYVFFHTTRKAYGRRFITGFFVVKDIGPGNDIVRRYGITGDAQHAADIGDHYVALGDEKRSKRLKDPGLLFDRNLAERLSFEPERRIQFTQRSELKCISDATRSIRVLSDNDVELLLREIRSSVLI